MEIELASLAENPRHFTVQYSKNQKNTMNFKCLESSSVAIEKLYFWGFCTRVSVWGSEEAHLIVRGSEGYYK